MSQPQVCEECSYNIYKKASLDAISCSQGNGSCFYAELLSPLNSAQKAFHDENLRGATTSINAILNNARNNSPNGLQLCFIRVPAVGIMLAWVEQDGPTPDDSVTSYSDPEAIKLAVGLIEPESPAY